MLVVKLGGSLVTSPELTNWLNVLVELTDTRIVIVPGGGPFADCVRQTQQTWQFSDDVAHAMALLAMDQYGLLLKGLKPDLTIVYTPDEILENINSNSMIWLPSQSLLHQDGIPRDWNTTSDSLAVWLSQKIHPKHLFILKSLTPNQDSITATQLARSGIVDPAFPHNLQYTSFNTWWVGPSGHQFFLDFINGKQDAYCQIVN